MSAIATKQALSWNDIEMQSALELPARETPQTVVVGCLAVCVGKIVIRDVDVTVVAQVCAAVQALNVALLGLGLVGAELTCDARGQ